MSLFDGSVKKINMLLNVDRSSVCLTVAVIFAPLRWWDWHDEATKAAVPSFLCLLEAKGFLNNSRNSFLPFSSPFLGTVGVAATLNLAAHFFPVRLFLFSSFPLQLGGGGFSTLYPTRL